jgi:hypothetical protein
MFVSLMSPSRSDYIFTTLGEWVWRVVSEDSFNNRPHRSFSLLTTHVHLVSLFNDLDHPMGLVMFLAIHRHHDFTKELKVTLLTGERHITFMERNHRCKNPTTTENRKNQYVLVSMFGENPPCLEYASRKFEQPTPDLVLVQKKLRLYQIAEPARRMLFDRNAKTAFAFDQSREEPTSLFLVRKPFLLIDCTGRIFTAGAVPPDTQLFQHIAKF